MIYSFAGVTLALSLCAGGADEGVSAAGIAGNGTVPCSDAIQRLIDANPNREIFFPDGTYLLDKPICTPAHPQKSVALRLSAFAKFKAVPGWSSNEAMVRLGAIHPANNIWLPGSWYWLKGGIIDGSGVAKGVSIDGGRETLVADVSMKGVRVGLHIKRGVNGGSSDADIRNVNIVGNNATNSIGRVRDQLLQLDGLLLQRPVRDRLQVRSERRRHVRQVLLLLVFFEAVDALRDVLGGREVQRQGAESQGGVSEQRLDKLPPEGRRAERRGLHQGCRQCERE